MEVLYTGLHQTPANVVKTAIEEDVDAIGVSILSGAHMAIFPEIIKGLKEQDAADITVFGGGIIPDDDIKELAKLGVKKIFTPGALTQDIVDWIEENVSSRRV